MKSFIVATTRPFLYALALVLGSSVAFDQLENGNEEGFRIIVIISSLILIIEIYTSWLFYRLNHPQLQMNILPKYERYIHWLHHILLPVITYFSGAFFILFNRSQSVRWTLYLINIFIFTVLFYNLRSYFAHQVSQEKVSHYIYDIIKLYLFFAINNILANALTGDQRIIALVFANMAFATLFIMLTNLRKQLHNSQNTLLTLITACTIGLTTLLTTLVDSFNALEVAFVSLLVFYFANAILHHHLAKTLHLSVLLEYLAILVLMLNIFINLN